ncbi:MAG: 16S rRNA (guanine(966)-N(2))-methyltransferase RsmD [Candidatus Dormibacteraeota bacterium]|nr:16S rRNA (guanine(966)-N(2))-methyltransferase RsmD [Candidatus Dormibacteraeota bacterium]
MSGALRVAGGEAGGRRLDAPKNIRPTSALVREAIFDSLGEAVVGAVVLDLFAGSGALGLEALSRGAARATFVDRDPEAVQALHRNVAALGYGERAIIRRAHVGAFVSANPEMVAEASIVLLDPPYNDPVLHQAVAVLDTLVGPDVTMVVERATRQAALTAGRLRITRERRYGDTTVSFLRL